MRVRFIEFVALIALAATPASGQGTISTYAGSPTCCNSADGLQATAAWLTSASGITMDKQGNLYIWQGSSSKVRKVSPSGVLSTVAGNGSFGYTGDGGPAIGAGLFSGGNVTGLAIDAAGNLYIGDGNNHAVRKVNTAGIISTVAGNGTAGFSGDGGAAIGAQLQFPSGIALDNAGNLYIADSFNNRVRRVTPGGIISTYAGNGNASYSGDGVQATTTAVNRPEGVAVDSAGNLYISETSDSRVRKVAPNGIIGTVAGQTKKTNGFAGDGGLATAALLSGPLGMAVDSAGNLYIADNGNSRVRKVDAAGIITTYAGIGNGTASTPLGDGGPATSAFLGVDRDLVFDAAGNLYILGSASGVERVRKVTPGAGLSTSPSTLTFSFTIGGAAPASQTVSVSSSSGVANFTAAASTTSGVNWLAVSPTSGATPATLTASVNPTGLPGGVYQGAITLTPTGGGVSPSTFSVILNVTGAGAPAIGSGGIVNASGYQAKLAPDTVFVIFGSAMGPPALVAGSPNYSTSLGGTSITFTPTGGGTAIGAKMIYTTAGQIAGLLPSSIAPGTYAVRVTYNTLTSAPQTVTVVARSFGIATANSAGTGMAQATIGNVNGGLSLTRFTTGSLSFGGFTWTLTPAHPGDTVVLWGTGGGADAANDTGGTSGDQTQAGNFSVSVSGRPIVPLYAGASSGYPGLWQINFTLPLDIAPNCFASVQVSAAGEAGNSAIVPIAASGQSACSDSQLSPATLASLDAGGTIVFGAFGMAKTTNTFTQIPTGSTIPSVTTAAQEIVSGGFSVYTAAEWAAIFAGTKIGACTVNDRTAPATAKNPAAPDTYLDGGPTLPFAGPGVPAGAALAIYSTNPGPLYDLLLANGSIVNGGKYTLSGSGGKGVGPFNVAVNFPSTFSVNGWDSLGAIDRSKPLTIGWTGGIDQVIIIGSTSLVVGKDDANNNIIHTSGFNCQVPASLGSYTIPTSVLAYLQLAGIDAASLAKGSAILAVETSTSQPFSLPLVGGGQAAITGFSATLAYSKNLAVQ